MEERIGEDCKRGLWRRGQEKTTLEDRSLENKTLEDKTQEERTGELFLALVFDETAFKPEYYLMFLQAEGPGRKAATYYYTQVNKKHEREPDPFPDPRSPQEEDGCDGKTKKGKEPNHYSILMSFQQCGSQGRCNIIT